MWTRGSVSHVADAAAATAPAQVALSEHESLARATLRRFFRHRLAIVGTAIVALIALLAIVGPFVLPDPFFADILSGRPPAPPSTHHLLGTDTSGRDVLARVVLGARTSLIVGFGAVAVYIAIGTVIGLLAGYFGGWVDQLLMRLTDTVLSIPTLLLVIIFVSVAGPSLLSVIAVIGLLGWPQVARIVRGQLLSLREAEFITAVRVLGVDNRGILQRHLLPNLIGPLTVVATFGIAYAILLEASLSFLGLGVQAPQPSLGNMIIEARAPAVLKDAPWFWLPPGIMIALLVLGVNFIGDGLRDALDPRSQRRV
jgi:peptide/nickel transport system permease protein